MPALLLVLLCTFPCFILSFAPGMITYHILFIFCVVCLTPPDGSSTQAETFIRFVLCYSSNTLNRPWRVANVQTRFVSMTTSKKKAGFRKHQTRVWLQDFLLTASVTLETSLNQALGALSVLVWNMGA